MMISSSQKIVGLAIELMADGVGWGCHCSCHMEHQEKWLLVSVH